MPQDNTILLLGAYGLAGRAILRALMSRGFSVSAAGRDERKLMSAIDAVKMEFAEAKIRPVVLDLRDEGTLMRELASAHVVINAIGPYLEHGEKIARRAIDTATHYIDIASEQEHFRRLKGLSAGTARAGVLLGVGFGLYPGISGILAGQLLSPLEKPTGAHIYLTMGRNPEGAGRAQLLTGILELPTRLQELSKGRLQRYKPSRTVEADFGSPFGKRNVLVWPQLEILSLSDQFALEECTTGIHSPDQSPPTRFHEVLTRLLAPQKRQWARTLLVSLAQRMPEASADDRIPVGAALSVEAWRGDHRYSLLVYGRDTEGATAILPVLAAERLMTQQGGVSHLRGVLTAHEFFSDDDMNQAMRDAGLEVSRRSEAADM